MWSERIGMNSEIGLWVMKNSFYLLNLINYEDNRSNKTIKKADWRVR